MLLRGLIQSKLHNLTMAPPYHRPDVHKTIHVANLTDVENIKGLIGKIITVEDADLLPRCVEAYCTYYAALLFSTIPTNVFRPKDVFTFRYKRHAAEKQISRDLTVLDDGPNRQRPPQRLCYSWYHLIPNRNLAHAALINNQIYEHYIRFRAGRNPVFSGNPSQMLHGPIKSSQTWTRLKYASTASVNRLNRSTLPHCSTTAA